MLTAQVKDRLALTREQAQAYEEASEALRKLQVHHEESAACGAQSLEQVRLLHNPSSCISVRLLTEHSLTPVGISSGHGRLIAGH